MQTAVSSEGFQDVLFHELHHRFYNSLQLLSASLGSLAAGHSHPEKVHLLQDRIGLLGALHRSLSEPLSTECDGCSLFRELCASVVDNFARRDVSVTVEQITLPDDPMVLRGLTLILVELVTNALKHAACDGQTRIWVTLEQTPLACRLLVANTVAHGGLVATPSPRVATRFVEAMGGTLDVIAAEEFVVCVTVPTVRGKNHQ